MARRSAPSAKRWVAKAWRRECGCKSQFTLTRRTYFLTTRPSPRRASHRGRVPQLRRTPSHATLRRPHRQKIRPSRQRELGFASALPPPRLCNPSSRRWRRPPRHSRAPRPPVPLHHPEIHPRLHPPTHGHLRQIPSPRVNFSAPRREFLPLCFLARKRERAGTFCAPALSQVYFVFG